MISGILIKRKIYTDLCQISSNIISYHRIVTKVYQDGVIDTIKVGYRYIFGIFINLLSRLVRNFFPVKRNAIKNGVEVPSSVSQQYRIIDNYLSTITTDDPTTEGGEVESHRKFTKSGDDVIIIGGGIRIRKVNGAKELYLIQI